jgi:hypothetical protein
MDQVRETLGDKFSEDNDYSLSTGGITPGWKSEGVLHPKPHETFHILSRPKAEALKEPTDEPA